MGITNSPTYQTMLFLRAIISTDYNTTRNSVNTMIWPDFPRKDLTKQSYPRISVIGVTETGDSVSIGGLKKQQFNYVLQLDIWHWDKPKDALIVTVGGSTYSGVAARDRIGRDVIDLMPEIQLIRYAAPDRVPQDVFKAAAKMGFYISRAMVMMEGRIELLQYFREQSICHNYHRYGNLGERALI